MEFTTALIILLLLIAVMNGIDWLNSWIDKDTKKPGD